MTTLIDTVKPTESYLEDILPQALNGRSEEAFLDAYLDGMAERLKEIHSFIIFMGRGGLRLKRYCWSVATYHLDKL